MFNSLVTQLSCKENGESVALISGLVSPKSDFIEGLLNLLGLSSLIGFSIAFLNLLELFTAAGLGASTTKC